MHEVYYAALKGEGAGWTQVVPGSCIAPDAAEPPPGEGWVGCGSGFAAFPAFLQNRISRVISEVRPTAHAVAKLAAPRLLAGKGVDASQALPTYFRDKVAFTQAELASR
jgi:tRNA threonylcarbamoyladenosine biosynthesis protein TsaB